MHETRSGISRPQQNAICVCCQQELIAVQPLMQHRASDSMQAGGFIAEGRVNGSLNLSRALGDMEYKQSKDKPPGEQMVTALPDLRTLALEPGHEFLLLACDGIWDVLTNQEV